MLLDRLFRDPAMLTACETRADPEMLTIARHLITKAHLQCRLNI
jgi:hypothetical protein